MRKEDFLKAARDVHSDKYSYSLESGGILSVEKVAIVCPSHGTFNQQAGSHLRGSGCPKCAQEKKAQKVTNQNWVFDGRPNCEQPLAEKVRNLFGDAVSLDKVVYSGAREETDFICTKHDTAFRTTPNKLLTRKKYMCEVCNREKRKDNFIQKAESIHGCKYGYASVEYVDTDTEVEIFCPEHGSFKQKPSLHLVTSGCQLCYSENLINSEFMSYYRTKKPSYLYVILISHKGEHVVKVGLSVKPSARYAAIKHSCGDQIRESYCLRGAADDLWKIERDIHFRSDFKKYRDADWRWPGSSECYAPDQLLPIIGYINSVKHTVSDA